MNLELYLTGKCMMNCSFCGAWYRDGTGRNIPFEKVCEILRDTRQRGYRYVTLSGGEPFTHDRMLDIVGYASNLGFYVSISTNGVLIDEVLADRLASKGVNVRVSLHTLNRTLHKEITGGDTLARVLSSIRLLSEKKRYFSMASTIFEANLHEIGSLADFALQHNAAFIRFTPVFSVHHGAGISLSEKFYERMLRKIVGWAIRNNKVLEYSKQPNLFIRDYLDILATRRCAAATSSYMAVAADLSLVSCPVIPPRDDLPAAVYQSPDDLEEFKSAFNKSVFGESLAADLKGRCAQCTFKNVCVGGCIATKLAAGLGLSDEQPICIWHVLKKVACGFDPKDMTDVLYYWQYHNNKRRIAGEGNKNCIRKLPIWELNYRYGLADRTSPYGRSNHWQAGGNEP